MDDTSQIEHAKLGELAEIEMGQSPPGDAVNADGLGLPLLNGPTEFGPHHPDPVQFTTDPRKRAQPGDLLFCVRGSTTGRMNWADQEYAIGRGIAALRMREGAEAQPFLRGLVELHLPRLLQSATGSTFPNVSRRQLEGLEVRAPAQAERHRIAAVVAVLDGKIELNRQMNGTLEALAQALFRRRFVTFEGHDRLADSETEFGEIPEGWEIGPFSKLATLRTKTVQPKVAPETEWEHFSIPAYDADERPAMERGDTIKSGKYRVPEDAVLASKLNPRFPRVWLPDVQHPDRAICSTEFMPFVPKRPEWRAFLYSMVWSEPFQRAIQSRATGTTPSRQRVRPTIIAKMPVVVPPPEAIDAFSREAAPLQERRLANLRQSRTLAALRDALLPELVSGHLRVPEGILPSSPRYSDTACRGSLSE